MPGAAGRPSTDPHGPDPAARLRRVLYAVALDPGRKFGSLEEQILFLGRAFRERGSLFLPLFLCPPGPDKLRAYHEASLPAECLELGAFRPGRLARLWRVVRRWGIEVVHWNFTEPLANFYVWGLSLLAPGVRHYYTDHISRPLPLPGPPRGLGRLARRLLLGRYARVVCVSQFVHDHLERLRCWPNLRRCHHFVNTDRFRPDGAAREALRRQWRAEGAFVVLTVAHLIAAKGVDVLCRAVAQVPAPWELWVVGEGPEAEPLRRLCDQLGLEDGGDKPRQSGGALVRFLGARGRVEPYLQAADCFVCPSLWAEAAGLVNLEALSAGLPVVASRTGGIPEYVADGQTGLLFPPGDADALAGCLRRLAEDPALRARLGQQGRQDAVARFSVPGRLADYLSLYQ
jgi:starch synthase